MTKCTNEECNNDEPVEFVKIYMEGSHVGVTCKKCGNSFKQE